MMNKPISETLRSNIIQFQLQYLLECILEMETVYEEDLQFEVDQLIAHAKLLT